MVGEDVDPKTSASIVVPYVFMFFLFDVLSQFLALVSALDMFGSSSYMQMLFIFYLSDSMTYFISVILVMLYLIFLLKKLFGKLLIFSTQELSSNPPQNVTRRKNKDKVNKQTLIERRRADDQ